MEFTITSFLPFFFQTDWNLYQIILTHNHNLGRFPNKSLIKNQMSSEMKLLQRTKVRKRIKIRKRYNQAPHLTQDTNGKVTTSQLDIINESQEVSPFPAGDHKASINRRARKHIKIKTEITQTVQKRTTALERSVKYLLEGIIRFHGASTSPLVQMWIKTHRCLVCMKDP